MFAVAAPKVAERWLLRRSGSGTPVAERDFLRVHRARGAAGHRSIPAVGGKLLFSHALRAALYGLFFHAAVHRFPPETEVILARIVRSVRDHPFDAILGDYP